MKKSIITTVIAIVAILFGAAEANARKTINAKGAVTVRTETVANFESLINKSVGKVIYEEGDKPSVKISGRESISGVIASACARLSHIRTSFSSIFNPFFAKASR